MGRETVCVCVHASVLVAELIAVAKTGYHYTHGPIDAAS